MKTRAFNFIFIMLIMGGIALTLGSSALLRLCLCMAFMLLLALISVLAAISTVQVKVFARQTRLERGGRAAIVIQLTHRALLPVGSFAVRLDGAEEEEETLFCGAPFKVLTREETREFPHRGVFSMGAGTVSVSDIFGFFGFSRSFAAAGGTITVTPRARELAPMDFPMGEVGPEAPNRHFPDDASSPSGVREWRDGDLIKRIHWKLTMKMYDPSLRNLRPMVRTYDEAARPDTLILPDLTPVDAVASRADAIEDAICDACLSMTRMQLEEGSPVRMVLGGSAPREIEGQSALELSPFAEALAQARFDSDRTYEQTLAEATRRLERTGAIVLVTSRLTLRVADCAIRLRQMGNTGVALIWITDSGRADAEKLISRLEMADIIARRDNPFQNEEQE